MIVIFLKVMYYNTFIFPTIKLIVVKGHTICDITEKLIMFSILSRYTTSASMDFKFELTEMFFIAINKYNIS